MNTFRLPSCQSLCQLHLGMKLFVFISISVFISKVPPCVCQLQWKARDTTESGSRFNCFHAIATALRGICLPLAEERLSHSGGFSSSWYSPTLPVLRTKLENEAAGFFVPKHSSFPTCICPQHECFFLENWQQQGPDGVRCNLLSQEKVRRLYTHSVPVDTLKAAFINDN